MFTIFIFTEPDNIIIFWKIGLHLSPTCSGWGWTISTLFSPTKSFGYFTFVCRRLVHGDYRESLSSIKVYKLARHASERNVKEIAYIF